MNENIRIKDYLKELSGKLQEGLIKPAELYSLQEKYELEIGDIRKIEDLAYRHLDRSETEMKRGRTESALAEMERAVTLQPTKSEFRLALAKLYLQRFNTRGYLKRDADQAQKTAETVFFYFPNHKQTTAFLKEVQKARQILNKPGTKIRFLPIILFIMLIIGIILFSQKDLLLSRFFPEENTGKQDGRGAMADASVLKSGKIHINTELLPASEFDTVIYHADFLIQNDAFAYRIDGKIQSTTKTITQLDLNLSWDGNQTETLNIIDVDDPELDAGETYPFSTFFYLKERPEDPYQASLTVSEIETKPSGTNKRNPVLYLEKDQLPTGSDIEVRFSEIHYLEGYDLNYFTIDYVIENTGYAIIEKMDYQLEWNTGDFEEPVVFYSGTFLSDSEPPLEPGERRAKRIFLNMPIDADHLFETHGMAVTAK